MSTSKMMAQRFAIDLSGMALGIWETARLLLKKQTQEEGREKLSWLQDSLEDFRRRSTLSDSLRIHLKEEFKYDDFNNLLSALASENKKEIKETIPAIEKLIQKTQGCLNESGRAKANFQRAL